GQESEHAPPSQRPQASDLPTPIAADIAKEVRTATDALARARSVLGRAGSVPAALLMEVEPDSVYRRSEPQTDWFIEPLLTPAEVASILRISRSAVARLGVPSVDIAGERRYRQSELRRYVASHETRY
ncbi:MAG TPA: helix-turn-helix domain-containing protein, partial [Gemmatimonadaceae bacterium]